MFSSSPLAIIVVDHDDVVIFLDKTIIARIVS